MRHSTTGVLSVDANGTTGGANFVMIATFTGAPVASALRLRVRDVNGTVFVITADLI